MPVRAWPTRLIQYQTGGSEYSLRYGKVERQQSKPPVKVRIPPM